jgi:hypothetical protein
MLPSSIKTFINLFFESLKFLAMVREKILVAFFKPKGMTLHWYRVDLVMIIVFFMSLGAMGIY